MRAPVVAGVAPGVGTSTLAAALHGVDGGVVGRGGRVDVLVCRADSLGAADAVGAPVLAVVADREPRLDRLAGRFGAVVTVPRIAAWTGSGVPEVAGLLAVAPAHRPARLRPYVDALLAIVDALVGSGALGPPARSAVEGRRTTPSGPVAPVAPGLGSAVGSAPGTSSGSAAGRAVVPRAVLAGPPVPVGGAAVRRPTPVVPVATGRAPWTPPVVSGTPVPAVAGATRIVAAAAGPVARAEPVRVGERPLWRGLQAVEPVRATGPGSATRDLDDDALDAMRAG